MNNDLRKIKKIESLSRMHKIKKQQQELAVSDAQKAREAKQSEYSEHQALLQKTIDSGNATRNQNNQINPMMLDAQQAHLESLYKVNQRLEAAYEKSKVEYIDSVKTLHKINASQELAQSTLDRLNQERLIEKSKQELLDVQRDTRGGLKL